MAALAAIGALIVGIQTVRQRSVADAQAQWWARVQWAAGLVFEPDESKRSVGFEALALLASSPLAGPDDAAFLAGLSFDVLAAVQERGAVDDVDFVPADDDAFVRPSDARPVVEVTRSEVVRGEAARGGRPWPGSRDARLDRPAGGDGRLTSADVLSTARCDGAPRGGRARRKAGKH